MSGFGFGSKFAVPVAYVKQGFDRISVGLDLPDVARKKLLNAYQPAIRSGNPRKEKAAIANSLRGVVWAWPWLGACAAEFMQQGMWPLYWSQLGITHPLRWVDVPREAREELLLGTLGSAAYEARRFAQIKDAVETTGWKMSLGPPDSRCLVSKYVVQQHRTAIEQGDYSVLPPFFPGDGSGLRFLSPHNEREREGA